MVPYRLYDMHCHLSQMTNAEDVARKAAADAVALFDCGVEPGGFTQQQERLTAYGNVAVGVGLHPWWLSKGCCSKADIATLCAYAQCERFIGEVGLDFSNKHVASRELQVEAFKALCAALAAHPLKGRVLSVHAVQSAGVALDILEAQGLIGPSTGCNRATCGNRGAAHSPTVIFHWFSGNGDELIRARTLGCYFSVNEMMLATRRGRAYAQQIPEDRLLLETDAPPALGEPYSAEILIEQLGRTLDLLAQLRRTPKEALAERIARTSSQLFGL